MEEIQENMTAGLTAIPGEDFQQWQDCWRTYVGVEGQYFEGD
jgi:hypothetical protein